MGEMFAKKVLNMIGCPWLSLTTSKVSAQKRGRKKDCEESARPSRRLLSQQRRFDVCGGGSRAGKLRRESEGGGGGLSPNSGGKFE